MAPIMASIDKRTNLWEATIKYVEALREFPGQEVDNILFVLRQSHVLLFPGQKIPSSATTPDEYVEVISEQLGNNEKIAAPVSVDETQELSDTEDDTENDMENDTEDDTENEQVNQNLGEMDIDVPGAEPTMSYFGLEELSMPQESAYNPIPDSELLDTNNDDLLNNGFSDLPPGFSDGIFGPLCNAEQWVNSLPPLPVPRMFAETAPSEERFRDSPYFLPPADTPPEDSLASVSPSHQEHSSADREIDQATNSSAPEETAVGSEMTIETLLATVGNYPLDMDFELDWGTVNRQDVLRWLDWLRPGNWVGGALINYFVRKWSTVNNVTIVESDWNSSSSSSLKNIELSTPNIFVPCFRSQHWTLVTADMERSIISHDDSLHDSQHPDGKPCHDCTKVSDAASDLLRARGKGPTSWTFRTTTPETQTNTSDCGIFVLRFLYHRVKRASVYESLPGDYRLQLAWEIVDDLEKYKKKYDLQNIIGAHMDLGLQKGKLDAMTDEETAAEDTRIDWGKQSKIYKHDLVHQLEQVAKIAIKGQELGPERAGRILQLTVNIASPEVYIQLKYSIMCLRESCSKMPNVSKSIEGVVNWGMFHTDKARSSLISLRFISWYIYRHVVKLRKSQKSRRNASIELLARKLSDKLKFDQTLLEQHLKNWERRGREWNNIIESMRDDINVILYLPDDVNIFPLEKPINVTEYRDLRVGEAKAMGDIFEAIRPKLTLPGGDLLYKAFLWNELPKEKFNIELWEDQKIRQMAYDSIQLQQAFNL